MRGIIVILAVWLTVLSVRVNAEEISREVVATIKQRIDEGKYVGVVVGIYDGKEASYRSFGTINTRTDTMPDADTVFEIASISKTFVSLLLADSVIRGEVAFRDPVQSYLPEGITLAARGGRVITLEDLATHYSGLPWKPANYKPPVGGYGPYSYEDLWSAVNDYQPERAAGEEYEYSNVGMSVLAEILALHSNTSFRDLVRKRITEPLAMKNTDVLLTKELMKRAAQGHDTCRTPVPYFKNDPMAGAGAINSTARDLLVYLMTQLGVIRSELYEAMRMTRAPRLPSEKSPFATQYIGLGWKIRRGQDTEVIYHLGSTRGFSAFAGFRPKVNRAVVVFTNSATSVDGIGAQILNPQAFKEFAAEVEAHPSPVNLADYEGTYRFNDGALYRISKSGIGLRTQKDCFRAQQASYLSGDRFLMMDGTKSTLEFLRDKSGKVNAALLASGDASVRVERTSQ